jgi:hypothetical protein
MAQKDRPSDPERAETRAAAIAKTTIEIRNEAKLPPRLPGNASQDSGPPMNLAFKGVVNAG